MPAEVGQRYPSPTGGGGGSSVTELEVQDEGSVIVAAADKVNFVGDGVTVTDVAGVPTVDIPAFSPPAGLLGTPKILLQSDHSSIASLSDGDPISQWDDESGNGNHPTSTSTARPLKRTEDGIVHAEFDGSNDILDISGMSAYTGQDFTIYLVLRTAATESSRGIILLWNGTADDVLTTTGVALVGGNTSGTVPRLFRNNVSWDMPRVVQSATNPRPHMPNWTVVGIRYRQSSSAPLGNPSLTLFENALHSEYTPSFSAHSMSRMLLGARYFSSTLQLFLRMDVRAVGVYLEDHSDHVFLNNLRYFQRKFGALVL